MHWTSDHIRLFSLVFFGGAMAVMTYSMLISVGHRTRRVRRQFVWYFLIVANAAYSSGYNYAHDYPTTPPAVISAFLGLGCLLAFLWHPKGDDRCRPHDGAITSRFLLWFDRFVRERKNRTSSGEGGNMSKPDPGKPVKAVFAVIATAGTWAGAALADGVITGQEWWAGAIGVIFAAGAVYGFRNPQVPE